MFKITLFVAVTLCYAACSIADSPPTTETAPGKEPSFLQRIRKRVSSFFDPLWKWFGNLFDKTVHPLKAIGGLMLRIELVAISLQEHIAFPEPKSEEDKREHAIAKSLTTLWQKLETMEKIDDILMNVTEECAQSTIVEYENVTKIMFEKIEKILKEEPELYVKFYQLKTKIEQDLANSTHGNLNLSKKMDDDEKKAFQEFINEFLVKKLVANKRFLLSSKKWKDLRDKKNKKVRDNYVLARSILKVAKNSETLGKLQSIYDEVIADTAKSMDLPDNLQNGVFLLFAELRIKIDQNPSLKSEIDLAAKDVISKTDENSGWDEDTLDQHLLL